MARYTSGIDTVFEVAGSDVIVRRVGWAGTMIGSVVTTNDDPVDLTNHNLEAIAEIYDATLIGNKLSDPILDESVPPRELQVVMNADPTTGKFTIPIPANLITQNPPLDSDLIKLAVVWLKRSGGTAVVESLFSIAYRRGSPNVG